MSVSRLNVTALQRDFAEPVSSKSKPVSTADVDAVTPQSSIETLASMIPTEPLALYTAFVALFLAEIGTDESQDQYLESRWPLLALFALAIPGYLFLKYRKNRTRKSRKAPWAEMAGATIAFAGWSLVMPGSPLAAVLDGSAERLWLGGIGIGAVALLALTGQRLATKATS